MDWFRMYGDMPNDPKIGTLSDSQFRTWVELLCAACKAEKLGSTGLTMDTVNWSLRRNVTETLQHLFDKGLIALNADSEIAICAWEKRQYESDSSTERVQRYRAKKASASTEKPVEDGPKDETLPKRSSNGLEQNRTDTEQNRAEQRPSAQLAAELPDWLAPDLWRDWEDHRKAKKAKMTPKAAELCIADLSKLRDQGHDPKAVIEHCIKNGWTGIFPPKEGQHARASPGDRPNRQEALEQRNREIARQLAGETA